jgi:hypothetical protein
MNVKQHFPPGSKSSKATYSDFEIKHHVLKKCFGAAVSALLNFLQGAVPLHQTQNLPMRV